MNIGTTNNYVCFARGAGYVSLGVNTGCGVEVGHESWIWIRPSVRQYPNAGSSLIVCAGAVIVKDAPEHQSVMGVNTGLQSERL